MSGNNIALWRQMINEVANQYLLGKASRNETIDSMIKATEEFAQTDEFEQVVKDYWDQFVDVKDLALGERNVFYFDE